MTCQAEQVKKGFRNAFSHVILCANPIMSKYDTCIEKLKKSFSKKFMATKNAVSINIIVVVWKHNLKLCESQNFVLSQEIPSFCKLFLSPFELYF